MEPETDLGREKKDRQEQHREDPEKEITLSLPNLSKLGTFKPLKAIFNPKVLIFLLLVLIPIIITIGVRLQPIELKMTEDWARNTVYTNVRYQVQASVNQQYPALSDDQRQALIDEQYAQVLKEQEDSLNSQITELAGYYKQAFQYTENNRTYTYLGDLDSYFYLRQARNYLEKGQICDKIIEGKCIDDHMFAPVGMQMERTLHPYAIVYTYRFLHLFNPGINLMYASFYLPTIIAVLVSLLAFLVAKKIAGNVAGFFASVFISTSTIFLTRTMGSDTDIWNIFFPILVLYLFIKAVEARTLAKKLGFAGLLGAAFGVYSFAWAAWWFSFDLMLLTYGLFLLYSILQDIAEGKINIRKITENRKLMHDLATFAVIFTVSGVFVSSISSFSAFISAPLQPFVMNSIDDAAKADIWPNVYTTVAELNNSSLSEVVGTVGGTLFFFLIFMGIILALIGKELKARELTYVMIAAAFYYLMVQPFALSIGIIAYLILMCIPFAIALAMVFKDRSVEIKYAMLLLLWTLASLYAAMKGVRFVLLLIPVAGVSFGVAFGKLHLLITSVLHRQLGFNRLAAGILLFLIFSIPLFTPVDIGPVKTGPVTTAYSIGRNFLPSISSTWAESLVAIHDASSEDAIINSWWDFGHWFKYFADRGVTFDGASQNVAQAHWIGKVLLSDDEDVSIGILRMLDCGANSAYEKLYPLMGKDSLKTTELINRIIVLDRADARKILIETLDDDSQADAVLDYTHCQPPEDYFITSEDMVGKAGVWAHFGSWDFERAYIYNNIQGKTKEEAITLIKGMGYTDNDSAALYSKIQGMTDQRAVNNWIASWPGYMTDEVSCSKAGESLLCSYGLIISQNQQYNVVVDSATINLTEPGNSYITVTYVSRTDNSVIGSEKAAPAGFVLTEPDGLNRYEPNPGLQRVGFDIIVDTANSQSILSDTALSQSLFTKLYFLDGRYTTHFQKFFDKRNNVVGHHIIVWKVDWEGQ